MLKSELLRALKAEISRHDFSTFLDAEPSFATGLPEAAVHEAELHGPSGG